MFSIELSQLRFYAYHGLYEEERILGSEFEVSVTVIHHPQIFPVQHLEDTIDYTAIYQLVKEQMLQPNPLLETLATTIVQEIFIKFLQAEEIKISIKKIHPSIISFEGSVGVSFEMKRNI
ncbi:MAG: dihydroneopterin aldolase [Chitinophagaceae bacterium]